jgi:methionine--tRNA ligase beta chain
MKGADEARRPAIVRTALEAIYAFAHFLAPTIPGATQTIFEKIGTAPVCAHNLRDDFYNLQPGTPVMLGDILFQKIETQTPSAGTSVVEGSTKSGSSVPVGKGAKGVKGVPSTAGTEEDAHEIDFTKVELRVGRITKVWNHETADRLYIEEIDVGAEAGGVRQIVSGLRPYYSLEEIQDRLVIVVCNLKESKFQGVMSFGMVLAAKSADGSKVELLKVPEGSVVGERVKLVGYEGAYPAALSAARLKKVKAWEAVAPDLHADDNGVACWKALPLTTPAGVCTVSAALASSPIS